MPPRRIRLLGRTMSFLVARAPWLWPLMRGPVTRFWNRAASSWDARMSPDRTTPLRAGLEHVGSPQRVLDVGTGTGAGAAVIAERFPEAQVTGVDLSEEMVERARENVPAARFQVGDAAALSFPEGSFNLVVQNNVPVYFSELARMLAPGGCLLVASTLGPSTPYYTPHALLRRRFTKLGLEVRAAEPAPPGDFFIACRPS